MTRDLGPCPVVPVQPFFRNTRHAADLFSLARAGNIYTRIMNPMQDAVEQRVTAHEGGVAAVAVASGRAAGTLTVLTHAGAGDHLVSSASLYGGTHNLFRHTLPGFGIDVSFVEDPDDLDAWRAAARPNTKLFFGETIGNPRSNVLDIEGVARVAHAIGVRLYPLPQQRGIAAGIPGADDLRVVTSRHGHDGFLIETDQVAACLEELLTGLRAAPAATPLGVSRRRPTPRV